MELIGELKEKVDTAKSNTEKKAIIEQAGMMLTDEELTEVSGGKWGYQPDGPQSPDETNPDDNDGARYRF